MELTSKQKKQLRSLGQNLDAMASIGKAGLTDSAVASIQEILEHRELLKVKIPAAGGQERQAMGDDLAQRTGSACVGIVGRTVLLYRPNPKLPPSQRVDL